MAAVVSPGVKRTLVLVTAILVLVAACGDDAGEEVVAGSPGDGSTTTVDPDAPVSSPADDGSTTAPGTTWARIEPTRDLVSPVVVTPDELVVDPTDDSTVLVHFYGGVQECFGARATAEETPDRVRITLELGSRADAGDRACIEIAEAQELAVTLAAPVGDRELVATPGNR